MADNQEKLHEECGVFGIISPKPVQTVGYTASALMALQHRGQEGAGIATFIDGRLKCRKNTGLVSEIFDSDYLEYVPDTYVAVGHARYSTTGTNNPENTQPIETIHSRLTCALAHNGNITNAAQIRNKMVNESGKVFHTTNDSEIINMLLIEQMIKCKNLERAIYNFMEIIEGAFSIVIATKDKLIAVRDRNGFRPLCMGQKDGMTIFSSETCALDTIGATFVRDVQPGEIVSVDISGKVTSIQHPTDGYKRGLCVFEYIYFARPDSVIDGMSVYDARVAMGRALARQQATEADMVCGVPDSGLEAAYGYSLESGIPYGAAFIKNKYVGRSFIVPSQLAREKTVNVKLNPLKASVAGKRIILVDDSIVRGTTSRQIIQSLRHAGAKEVHMRISCPPFKHPCYFGVDIDSEENLIANKYSVEEICKQIGADSLVYLDLDELLKIKPNDSLDYCRGCFTGEYPIAVEATGKDKFDD